MENRIKEYQLDLFADRTSTATMRANQLRLWLASMAYALLCALRRIGLAYTQFAEATCGTIRLKLLKLGALVRIGVQTHQGRDGLGMPVSERVWSRLHPPQKCRRSLTEPEQRTAAPHPMQRYQHGRAGAARPKFARRQRTAMPMLYLCYSTSAAFIPPALPGL